MNADLQTLVALGMVAVAAWLLVRTFWKKRKSPGCGSSGDCGAVSPEIKKLQTKLRR